jgi:hypothetical protein
MATTKWCRIPDGPDASLGTSPEDRPGFPERPTARAIFSGAKVATLEAPSTAAGGVITRHIQ